MIESVVFHSPRLRVQQEDLPSTVTHDTLALLLKYEQDIERVKSELVVRET